MRLEYVEYLKEVRGKVDELNGLLGSELGFKLNEVLSSYSSIFYRFCPYAVGDRVALKEDLDIPASSGWYGSKHFLVKGAIATVKILEYQDDHFVFGLVFDDDSWIDLHGQIVPSTDKCLYHISEKRLEMAETFGQLAWERKERIETLECALADAHKEINRLQDILEQVNDHLDPAFGEGFSKEYIKDLIVDSVTKRKPVK